jgi:hypothetical protein
MLGYHPLTLVTYDPYFPGGHIRIVRRTYNQLWRIKDGVAEATDGSVFLFPGCFGGEAR